MKKLTAPESSIPGTPTPPASTPQEQPDAGIRQIVENLASITGRAYLVGAAAPQVCSRLPHQALTAYVQSILNEASNPSDSAEKALILQIQLAHQAAGNLLIKAASAGATKDVKALNTEAAKMMAEARKTALALKTYREPPRRRATQFVQRQQIAVVQTPPTEPVSLPVGCPLPAHPEPRRVANEPAPASPFPTTARRARREPVSAPRRPAPDDPPREPGLDLAPPDTTTPISDEMACAELVAEHLRVPSVLSAGPPTAIEESPQPTWIGDDMDTSMPTS